MKRARQEDHDTEGIHDDANLNPLQRSIAFKLLSTIKPDESSVVITNPLLKGNPIVYVTKPWEAMCGYSYDEAVNRNPRITQGNRSEEKVIKDMSHALSNERACKVCVVNYRGGHEDQPFWNILSISPVRHRGNLQLYIANLQDYTSRIGQLVSLTPSQFCKAAERSQSARTHLTGDRLSALALSKPRVFEADEETVLELDTSDARGDAPAMPPMKRLGWNKLEIEPEHLADRVADALLAAGASFERQDIVQVSGETIVVDAGARVSMGSTSFAQPQREAAAAASSQIDAVGPQSNVALRFLVNEDADGRYRISCSRLNGDTFAFHKLFRELKEHLGDSITSQPLQQRAVGVMGNRLALAAAPSSVVPLSS